MLRMLARTVALPFIATITLSAQIVVGGVTGGVIGGSQTLSQAPAPPGTAALRGHVFAADTGQPLRKAQVRIFAGEIRENRMATTDEHGAYEFNEVRAGRYTISASKDRYVSLKWHP